MKNGDWLLLDEINLASTDALNFLYSLLEAVQSGERQLITQQTGP
jgi:midasin (ATPase involved in ribosome maturation)